MENIDINTLLSIGAMIVALIGAGVSIYRAKPQRRKDEADGDSAMGDAAESIANGSKTITDQLIRRVKDLEKLEKEHANNERQMRRELTDVKNSLADWQDWARRLVHQVKSLGHEPVSFKIEEKKK